MKKKMVALGRLIDPTLELKAYPENFKSKIKLPAGCLGMLLVFESKAAARRYWGKGVCKENLIEIRKCE